MSVSSWLSLSLLVRRIRHASAITVSAERAPAPAIGPVRDEGEVETRAGGNPQRPSRGGLDTGARRTVPHMLLTDLGADVVKVEPSAATQPAPGVAGSELGGDFASINRSSAASASTSRPLQVATTCSHYAPLRGRCTCVRTPANAELHKALGHRLPCLPIAKARVRFSPSVGGPGTVVGRPFEGLPSMMGKCRPIMLQQMTRTGRGCWNAPALSAVLPPAACHWIAPLRG